MFLPRPGKAPGRFHNRVPVAPTNQSSDRRPKKSGSHAVHAIRAGKTLLVQWKKLQLGIIIKDFLYVI